MPSGMKVCHSSAESTNVTLDTAHGNVNEFHRNSLVTINLLKRLTPNQTKEIFARKKTAEPSCGFFYHASVLGCAGFTIKTQPLLIFKIVQFTHAGCAPIPLQRKRLHHDAIGQ